MKKSILIAGFIGVLVGGAAAYAASTFLGAKSTATEQDSAIETNYDVAEAREIADAFVAKLKEGKFEEFATHAKLATPTVTEDSYGKFKARLDRERALFPKMYGNSTGEFDLVSAKAVNDGLARVVYLEKFDKGGVLWFFILYKGTDTWKLSYVDWSDNLALAFADAS